jgi:hypothetical protein
MEMMWYKILKLKLRAIRGIITMKSKPTNQGQPVAHPAEFGFLDFRKLTIK